MTYNKRPLHGIKQQFFGPADYASVQFQQRIKPQPTQAMAIGKSKEELIIEGYEKPKRQQTGSKQELMGGSAVAIAQAYEKALSDNNDYIIAYTDKEPYIDDFILMAETTEESYNEWKEDRESNELSSVLYEKIKDFTFRIMSVEEIESHWGQEEPFNFYYYNGVNEEKRIIFDTKVRTDLDGGFFVVNRGENKQYSSFNEWWQMWISMGYDDSIFNNYWYSENASGNVESGYLYQEIEEKVYKRLTKREIESLWDEIDLWAYSGK